MLLCCEASLEVFFFGWSCKFFSNGFCRLNGIPASFRPSLAAADIDLASNLPTSAPARKRVHDHKTHRRVRLRSTKPLYTTNSSKREARCHDGVLISLETPPPRVLTFSLYRSCDILTHPQTPFPHLAHLFQPWTTERYMPRSRP